MKQFAMQMKFRVGHVVAALWACLFIIELFEISINFESIWTFRNSAVIILATLCILIIRTVRTRTHIQPFTSVLFFVVLFIILPLFTLRLGDMAQMFDKEAGKCFSILCYVPKGSIYCTHTHTQSHV